MISILHTIRIRHNTEPESGNAEVIDYSIDDEHEYWLYGLVESQQLDSPDLEKAIEILKGWNYRIIHSPRTEKERELQRMVSSFPGATNHN